MADRSEVLELLNIVDLARQHPNLKNIHDHAMAQLVKANEEHTKKDEEEERPARPVIAPRALPRG